MKLNINAAEKEKNKTCYGICELLVLSQLLILARFKLHLFNFEKADISVKISVSLTKLMGKKTLVEPFFVRLAHLKAELLSSLFTARVLDHPCILKVTMDTL